MPSAPWRRAPAPRAGGGRAAFRFGWGGGGSRRRQAHEQGPAACGALGDAALPRWARGAAGGRVRRCLPCGQRRFRIGAPDHGVSREKAGFRNVSPIRGLSRRAGGRGNGLLPARGGVFPARRHPYALTMSLSAQETEIRAIPQSKRTLPPAKPSTFIHPWQTRPFSSRVSSPPHFAANIRRAQAQLSTPTKGHLSALPVAASSPNHPAGRTAGSARTRSRVQTLENPCLGNSPVFPSPVFRPPKPPQAAGPCSWACRRLPAPSPQTERTAADPPPARGAGLRHHGANGTGWRPCRPCRPTKAGKSSLGRRAPKSLSNSRARRTQSRP